MNIVITGASRGIGKAIAEKYAGAGYTLFLCSRNVKTLQQTAAALQNKFPACKVHFMPADLSLKKEAIAFGNFCINLATPDILINNAGSYAPGNISDEEDGTLESMIGINLYSAYHLTRTVLPQMLLNKSGHIFNICSVASLNAYPGGGSYSISKYALSGFNENLRQEVRDKGINVTGIFPGAVFTDSWGDFDNSKERIMEATDIADMIFACTQLPRRAMPETIIMRPAKGDL